MKKIFSILAILLSVGLQAQTPSLPVTTVNNLKITNPVSGSDTDQLLVRKPADGIARTLPALTFEKKIFVNVKDFGAIPDDNVDDRAAIMAAMASLDPINGGTIFFPTGKYITSDRLDTTAPNTTFTGSGATLIYKKNKVGIVFMHDHCTVDNMSFDAENETATSAVNAGVFIQGASYGTVKNCNFSFNGNGVCVFSGNSWKGNVYSENSPYGNVIENNIFISEGVFGSIDNFAGVLMGFAVEKPVIGNKVLNNYIEGNFVVDHGIALIGAGYDNIIEGNTINNVRSYGALLYQTEFLTDYSVHHNIISNNRIKGVGNSGTLKGMGIYTQKGHYNIISGNTVTNAEIGAGVEGTLAQAGISIDGGTYNVVTGNVVNDIQANKPAIRVNNSFFTEVVSNNFENAGVGISITESNDVNVSGNIGKTTGNASMLVVGGLTQSTLSPPYNSIASGLNINVNGNNFVNTSAASNTIDISGVGAYSIDNLNFSNNSISIAGNGMNLTIIKNTQIQNNIIKSISATGKSGVLLNSGCDNITISNNKIFSTSGTFTNGIVISGSTSKSLLNDISNATTPVSNSGSVLIVNNSELNYNKNLIVGGNISTPFVSVTTPGASRADISAVGDAMSFGTSYGQMLRLVHDDIYDYFQIGGVSSRGVFTAASGGAMTSVTFNAASSIFSGAIKITVPTYADDITAGSGGLTSGDVYKTATGELRIKL